MSFITRFNPLFALAFCAAWSTAIAAVTDQSQPNVQDTPVKIKLTEMSMITVPVSINGSGPYDFMLDTGSAKTIVDQKLATELRLRPVGEKTVIGMLASRKMSVVHVDSLSVGGAVVPDGEVFSTDHAANIDGKVRGVLGEDFLRNFDLLIDYRHLVIRLESAPGSMSLSALGERLPLQLTSTCQGKPTRNRLIVGGRIPELGNETMGLLLDSGANQLTLFRDTLGAGESRAEPIWTASFSHWVAAAAAARTIRSLKLGSSSVSDVTAIALSRRADVDSDGLLPTSLFHSVLISHVGGFVILNPSFPKTGGDVPPTPGSR
ncbi:MAG TPA: retropepsin-like aspartic protease [Acidobacteriaceae bacterium]